MGDLKSRVHASVHNYLLNDITNEQFKAQIRDVIVDFEGRMSRNILLQDIGLIVQERERKIGESKFVKVWAILDEIEPLIRKKVDYHNKIMKE